MQQRGGIGSTLLFILLLALAAWGATTPALLTAPTDTADHFQQGNVYTQSGEFDKAIAEYQLVLQADPGHVSAQSNLGVAYYQMGDLEQAITQYQQAIALAPGDADIHSNLAAALFQLGQFDKALDEYRRAVELAPQLAEAHFGLGVVQLQLGNSAEAIQAFERFQELDSGIDPMATEQAAYYLQQLKGQ